MRMMELPTGKRVLSAAQPTGAPHIGNYLGAFQQWVALQDTGNACFFPIVDLHAITLPYDPKTFPDIVLRTAALYCAVGIDPQKSTLFVQSHIPAHTEAAWLLTTITPVGDLTRMTQFKDKAQKQKTVGAGLLNYPILMAADILLYRADLVPVGEDQIQHLEFARTLAHKFNRQFGETLKQPRAFLLKDTGRIMSLADPARKMSKSDSPASAVSLWDAPDSIRRKIRSAVTDSGTAVNPKKLGPALRNLLMIYASFSGKTVPEVAGSFAGQGYAAFKITLAELLIEKLSPIRERAETLFRERQELRRLLREGADRARAAAEPTLAAMKNRMGLHPVA